MVTPCWLKLKSKPDCDRNNIPVKAIGTRRDTEPCNNQRLAANTNDAENEN